MGGSLLLGLSHITTFLKILQILELVSVLDNSSGNEEIGGDGLRVWGVGVNLFAPPLPYQSPAPCRGCGQFWGVEDVL